MPHPTNTQRTIDKAISDFHDCLEVEFPHLKEATYLDCDDIAALSKAIADRIPVPDLSALTELGKLSIAEFEFELHHVQSEVDYLLDAFMAPLLDLPWSSVSAVSRRVKGEPLRRQSVPARLALKSIWGRAHAAAANRICPAVGKVFVRSGAHGYNLFMNKAYARALEFVLRNRQP